MHTYLHISKKTKHSGVRHHVRERAARAEAGDGAALPPVLGPPVEDRAPHWTTTHSFSNVTTYSFCEVTSSIL